MTSACRHSCESSRIFNTLNHYFKHACLLSSYLERLLPHLDESRLADALDDELQAILRPGVIAYNDDAFSVLEATHDALVDIGDVIERCQAIILQRQKFWQSSNDVLTMGMRRADQRSDVVTINGRVAVEHVHVNERVTQLMVAPLWQAFFSLVGAQGMEHLLLNTSLFLPLPGSPSNYLQIWGSNAGNMNKVEVQEARNVDSDDCPLSKRRRRQRKRKRGADDLAGPESKRATRQKILLADLDLHRSRLFYAKAQHYRSGLPVTGLPVRHILNRVSGTTAFQADTVSRRAESTFAARELAKHIWPHEYKILSVPTSKGISFEGKPITTNQRDTEVDNVRNARTPRRLQKAVRLLDVLLRKHRRFDYRKALDLCCPSTLPRRQLSTSERQTILVDLCEVGATQTQFVTQKRLNDHESQPRTQFKVKPEKARFAKYKMSYGAIIRYVNLVVRSVVPIELFGSYHNRAVVLRACRNFVCARRNETMTMHEVLQGVRLLDCEWTASGSQRRQTKPQRSVRSDERKRKELMQSFLYWLFDGILLPLLRTNFYATESAKYRNRVLYFRQQDWQTISQPILEALKEQCFERIEKYKAVAIMSRRDFGYSFVRLLPKEVGMRPIVNLKRRSVKIDRHPGPAVRSNDVLAKSSDSGHGWGHLVRQRQSINAVLAQTFQVLRAEREENPSTFGSTVSGPLDIFEHLLDFKARLESRFPKRRAALFFIKMDVAGAFDCIDQSKLLAIVDDVIQSERYLSQRYARITFSRGKPLRSWPRFAVSEEMHEPFDEFAQRLTQLHHLRDTILVDVGNAAYCQRAQLIELLGEHISNNLVKIEKEFCRQKIGIPQGSTLSTMLCNFYLAKMERELRLQRPWSPDHEAEELLMRYTDDFLFISTDVTSARRFFQTLTKGSAAYNCVIAAEKSLSNFPMLDANTCVETAVAAASVVQLIQSPHQRANVSFPWCAHRIDTQTLAVQYDWERYTSTCVADTLTVPSRTPFSSLLANVVSVTVQRRNLQIYLNVELNGLEVVLSNIYQAFQVAGLKFIAAYAAICKRIGIKDREEGRRQALLLRYVIENVEHCYAHACAKMRRQSADDKVIDKIETRVHVFWPELITSAMYRWLAVDAIQSTFAFRAVTNRLEVSQMLASHRQSLERAKGLNVGTINQLRQVAAKSWRDTRHIIRTMTLQ